MGLLAKRRTKRRMEPRRFSTTLSFAEVLEEFRAVADETKPLKGILSKGRKPHFTMVLDGVKQTPVVSYGRPSLGRQSGTVGVWTADWRVSLTPVDSGFGTRIYEAQTWNGEIGDFAMYERFHAEFLARVAERDPTMQELPTTE